MPKQSREQIIAELDARKVGYSEDMSYNELCQLLAQAQVIQAKQEHGFESSTPEEPIDYSGILCGLTTIQGLHRRITILERKLSNA